MRSREYRPSLDGVRALAVYLVVFFHAGSSQLSGGFVGVDVFFVLSGFLVTQLLLRDLSSVGSIRFRTFYARRFRRLLPAAFAVLIVTAAAFTALASPVEVAQAEGGFRAAFLYVTNWYFIDQSTDYFGADLSTNPVLHFWSLAVEEQFYLLWPLLLGGLFALTRRFGTRQRDLVRIIVLAAAVASVAWAWSMRASDPSRAYFATEARAYQLMAGALLALTPGLVLRAGRFGRSLIWTAMAAILGLVLVASSVTEDLDPIERGVAATALTALLLVSLEGATRGLPRRALSFAPVVYLGRISYGTYLWHWPIVLVLGDAFDLSTASTVAWTVLLATALASLSFQVLEQPIRLSDVLDRYRVPVIAGGLAISVVSALVIIPAIVEPSDTTAQAALGGEQLATDGFTPVPELDFTALKDEFFRDFGAGGTSCQGQPVTTCTLVEGDGAHLLLLGDSHAWAMIPAFVELADQEDLTLSVTAWAGCPWQRGVQVKQIGWWQELCENLHDDVYDRLLPALDPDIVVVMNRGYERGPRDYFRYLGPDHRILSTTAPELDEWLEDRTVGSIDELRGDGRSVVVIEPIPEPRDGSDLLDCLADATVVEACRYVVAARPSPLEELYRRLDDRDDQVWSTDLDRLVCPYLPICDPIVDHVVVKIDSHHLTTAFARSLAPSIGAYLKDNGILPR